MTPIRRFGCLLLSLVLSTSGLFALATFFDTSAAAQAANAAAQAPQTAPPLLFNIVMHNEEPPQYPDYINNPGIFWQHRNALVTFVNMLHDMGVKFNYQSDWNFLMAVGLYDTGTPETNGKNVVRYIREDLGFEVDPHAHETQYNYADVAYLIQALGVTPSHTVGGFIADPPEASKLEYLWQPLTATHYPTYTWQAEILWGGGTYFHQDETALWVSGIWKPQDNEHFRVHSDSAPLPNIGSYGGNCDRLILKRENGELLADQLYTCTIFVPQISTTIPGFTPSFAQEILRYNAAGHIRWVGLAETLAIWQTEYGSQPNLLPYETYGAIAGVVSDSDGLPVPGAQVYLYGAEAYSATTDAAGAYAIPGVPVSAPRYILVASAEGYQPTQQGDVDVSEGLTATADLTLSPGEPFTATLEVHAGYVMRQDPSGPTLVAPTGTLRDPASYPAEVLPYLQPGRYIETDDPDIVAVAQSILDGVPPELRGDATYVAHEVYVWMVKHIEYDLINNYPGDVTSGNWQTTFGGWGRSFADWDYTASEVLQERRAICVEHARLATALLRALDIPARPAPLMNHPVTQWWVQPATGSGFWANMDTSTGRTEYVRTGNLWARFPAAPEHAIGFWEPDADAPIHVDWQMEQPTLWWEHYGSTHNYSDTQEGLAEALGDLEIFAATGVVTPGGVAPTEPHYWLYSRGFASDLTNDPLQETFVVSFPLPIEGDYTQLISITHWTNHPEWPTLAYTATESDAETGESLTWYVVEIRRQFQYDAGMAASVVPGGSVAPGEAITYTLAYANGGPEAALHPVITDSVPGLLTGVTWLSAGAEITLTGNSPYVWQVEDLSPGEGGVITITALISPGTPAGTILTNTATIASVISDTSPDNNAAIVTSTVLQVAGAQLAPDHAATALPGSLITLTHTLTNTGNAGDVYILTHESSQGWEATYPVSLTLDAGEAATVVITIAVPTEAISGTVETAVMTAISQHDTGFYAAVTDTVTVLQVAGAQLAPDHAATALPGSLITLTHTLTNTGNAGDVYILTHESSQGWEATYPVSLTLDAGEAATVVITIAVPTEAISGTVETIVITATSQHDTGFYATVTDTVTVEAVEAPVYRVYLPFTRR